MSVINSSKATSASHSQATATSTASPSTLTGPSMTTTNSSMPSMVPNSSLRHPLEQHSSSHPIPNSPGPMTLHLNDSSIPPPPPHSSSSLLPLLNSVPIINRLPSIDAASIAGLSNTGSIRSNNSSLRLGGNSIYNKASGAILPSPTLNHRIHGSRHRRTDLQQQIQLQLHQQQLQLHQPSSVNQPPQQLQLGRQGRHRHLSNCSSLTSSSDHSDLSCVTDDETANSCCNVNCFNCNSKSKHHHQHNSNRSGHSRRHGHGLNSQQPSNHLHHQISHQESSLDEGQHLNCHQTTSNPSGSHHRQYATSDNAINLTMTDDEEMTAEMSDRRRVDHCREGDYRSLGGCICCVPIFCCPNLCIANCNGQIITSYILAIVATALVVSGVYCSLLYWDRSWLSLSVLGVVIIIVGTIIHYTGSNSLARKLRRISSGPSSAGKKQAGHRQQLRQLRPMSEQIPIEFQHQITQQISQTINSIDHSSGHDQLPKTKQKATSHANVNGNSLNNTSESTTSRVVSVSSAFEPSTSTSNVVYEELVNSSCGTFNNCDEDKRCTSEYQKVNRASKRGKQQLNCDNGKGGMAVDGKSSDSSSFNLPLGPLDPLALNLVGRCIEDTDTLDHNRTNTMSTTVSNSQSSCKTPQIVNLNGQSYLILPIHNSSSTGDARGGGSGLVSSSTLDRESMQQQRPSISTSLAASAPHQSQCHASPARGQFEDSSNEDDDSSNGEGDSDYVDEEEENIVARDDDDEDDEQEDDDDDDDEANDDNSSNNCLLSPDSFASDATGLRLIPLDLFCPSNASTITRKQSVTDFLAKLDPSRLLSSQSYINNQDVLLGQGHENASCLHEKVRTQALLAHQINLMKQQQQRQLQLKLLPSQPPTASATATCVDDESCIKKATQKQPQKLCSPDTGSNENESLIHSFSETHGEEILLLHANLAAISPDASSSSFPDAGGAGRGKKFIKKGNRTSGGTNVLPTSADDASRFRKKKGAKVKKSHKKVKLIGQVSQLDSLGSPDECQQTDQEDLSLISLPSTSTHCNSITTSPSMAPSSTTEDIAIGTIDAAKFTSLAPSTDSSTVSTPIASSSSMSSSYHESLTSSNSTNSAGLGDTNPVTSPSISSSTASPSHVDVHLVNTSQSTCTVTASVTCSTTKVKNAPTIIDITNSSFDPLAAQINTTAPGPWATCKVKTPATLGASCVKTQDLTNSPSKVILPASLESFTLQLGLNDTKKDQLSQGKGRNSVTLPLIGNKLQAISGKNEQMFQVTNCPQEQQRPLGDVAREGNHRQLTTSMSTPTTPTSLAPATSVKIAIKQANCSQQPTESTGAEKAVTQDESVTTATDVLHGHGDNNSCDDDESDSGESTASSSSFLFFIPPENAKSPRFKRKKSARNKTYTLSKAPQLGGVVDESVKASTSTTHPLVTCHGANTTTTTFISSSSSGCNSIWTNAKSNDCSSGTCFSTSVAIGNLDEISKVNSIESQLSPVSMSQVNYYPSNCNLKNSVASPSHRLHQQQQQQQQQHHHQQQQSTSSSLVDEQLNFEKNQSKLKYSSSVPLATSCASQQLMVNSINNTYPSSSCASSSVVDANVNSSSNSTSSIPVLTNLNASKDSLVCPLAHSKINCSTSMTNAIATNTNASTTTTSTSTTTTCTINSLGNLIGTSDSLIESNNLHFHPSALVTIESNDTNLPSALGKKNRSKGKKEEKSSLLNRIRGKMNEKLANSPLNVNCVSLGYPSNEQNTTIEDTSAISNLPGSSDTSLAVTSNELKSTIARDKVISGQGESAVSTGDRLTNRHATRTIDRSSLTEVVDGCTIASSVKNTAAGRMVTSSGASDASSNAPRGPSIKGSLCYDQKDILSTSSTSPANPTSGANVISDGAMCGGGKADASTVTSCNLLQRSTGDGSTLCTSLGKSNDQPSHHSTPMVHQASSSSPSSHSPSAVSSLLPFSPSPSSSSSSFLLPTTAAASAASVFNTSKSMANVVTADEVSNIQDSCNNHPLGGRVNETLTTSTGQASSTSFFIAFPSSQSTIQGTSLHQPSSKVMTEQSASLATPGNEASGSCFISIATTDLGNWRPLTSHADRSASSAPAPGDSFAIQISSPTKAHAVARSDTFSKGAKKSHKKKQSANQVTTEVPLSQAEAITSASTTTAATTAATPDKSTGAVPRRVKRNVTQTLESNLQQAIDSSATCSSVNVTSGASDGASKKSKSKIKPPTPVKSNLTSNAPTASVNYTSNDDEFATCNYYYYDDKNKASASASALNFYPHVYEELYFSQSNSSNTNCVNTSNQHSNNSPKCIKVINNNNNLITTSNYEDGIDRGLYDGGLDNVNCNLDDECTTNITIQSPPPSYFDVIENSSQYQTLSQFELQTYLKSTPSPKLTGSSLSTLAPSSSNSSSSTQNYIINCHTSLGSVKSSKRATGKLTQANETINKSHTFYDTSATAAATSANCKPEASPSHPHPNTSQIPPPPSASSFSSSSAAKSQQKSLAGPSETATAASSIDTSSSMLSFILPSTCSTSYSSSVNPTESTTTAAATSANVTSKSSKGKNKKSKVKK